MDPISLGLLGISGLTGLFGGRGASMSPAVKSLQDQLVRAQGQLFAGADLTGYGANATQQINHNYDLQKQRLQENLASRGVTGDALGFAEAGLDRSRFGDVTQLQNSLPLLMYQMKQGAVSSGANVLSAVQGVQPQQGNVAGNFFGNLGNTLAYLYGQGAFNKPNKPPTPFPNSTID